MSKWEYNAKLFLDNYKNAVETLGTESLTWLAFGIPSKKVITSVNFVEKSPEAILKASSTLKNLYLAPVELLGGETATGDIPAFSGLKFAWSLLKNITAQKLAQRLVSVKHSDALSVPAEDTLLKVNFDVKLSLFDGKDVRETVAGQVEEVLNGLNDVSFVGDGLSLKSDAKSTSLKVKDQKKEVVALRVFELQLDESNIDNLAKQFEKAGLNASSNITYTPNVILRVNNDVSDGDLVNLFKEEAKRLLSQIVDVVSAKASLVPVEVLHYNLSGVSLTISVVLPKEENKDKVNIARVLNRKTVDFGVTKNVKWLARPQENGLLANPHEFVKASPIGQVATVLGHYDYHHYMQDNVDDGGWGCAYRSFQTVFSWLRYQGFTDKPIPSHKDIQECLVEVGDKPASFVGSKQWIGSMELSFCLNQMLGMESKLLTTNSGAEVHEHARTLIYHFENHGAPVMIGGGMLAHTILGVDYNTRTGECKYLVLDPHYTGDENISTVTNGGWCSWKNGDFWKKSDYYNLLLPQTEGT
ncbi:unnamed protein product [Bursaphelenchus okinawaensis]|uniref:Ufm1-specific protease n=1 Tax=Bursaphelenchus okinawaensis TaxID=465554 RepID=A0A811KZ22_9BILA|nr:unnamed protein product [Bursaphelenchus okinawaensis]CAG9114601.1 unnamed protein product [Bursaphelenchus okinawaensis]